MIKKKYYDTCCRNGWKVRNRCGGKKLMISRANSFDKFIYVYHFDVRAKAFVADIEKQLAKERKTAPHKACRFHAITDSPLPECMNATKAMVVYLSDLCEELKKAESA